MTKKQSKPKAKKQSKAKVEPENKKYEGPTRTFRFVNPIGHPDKYDQITLKKGDHVPNKIKPILEKESKLQKAKDRVEELKNDLLDDGKANNSKNKDKKSPGRKTKKK